MGNRKFRISIATWSFHRRILAGELDMLGAISLVRDELDLGGIELVNTLLAVPTARYVSQLSKRADEKDVEIPLLMVDLEGSLGAADADERRKSVRDHVKWIHIAGDLGCNAIRVNWFGWGDDEGEPGVAFIERSRGSFEALVEKAEPYGVDIIVENHGGPSSDPALLVELMKAVDSEHFGTLPDFGNFPPGTDTYAAVEAMMPWAKAVSAKCYDFDDHGNETTIDFERMLSICIDDHGYSGWVGVEYEGRRLDELDGSRACRDLLQRLR